MDSSAISPPRLFVIMAAHAPSAIVIRRGPSSWVQLTSWDTDCDAFTEGAWFHGRIFADHCDLSPDGELFVHKAHKGALASTSYTDCWTAVSRPPWLHALALWPMQTTYGGGGRFTGNRELVLRGVSRAHDDHPPHGLTFTNAQAARHRSTDEVPYAEWTGRDQRNRLVFAARGCIFARVGLEDRLLADFNGREPRPAPAPPWAKQALEACPKGRARKERLR